VKAQTEHESREQPSQAAHVRNDVKLPSVPQDAKLPPDQGPSLASLILQTPEFVPQDVKLRPELGLSSPISAEEKSGQAPPFNEGIPSDPSGERATYSQESLETAVGLEVNSRELVQERS